MKLFEIWIIVCSLHFTTSKPTKEKAGPCANAEDPMACLHGMLMHGDDHQGDAHKAEDQYLRFQPVLRTGNPEKAGPQDAEQTFHASMMHNGEDPAHAHQGGIAKPQIKEKLGPQDAEAALHGVMMHGDDQQGQNHDKEHKHPKSSTGTEGHKAAPLDAEHLMHGVLMHGDSNVENHHVHANPNEKRVKEIPGPVDLEQKMHKLMHKDGDVHHDEQNEDSKKTVPGPRDQEDVIHKLMHNGENLMHEILGENKPFKFNIAEIMKLGIDPDILKSVGLDRIKKDDEADYKEWRKEQNKDDTLGETIAYISDSIVPDIELMKRRYMNLGEEVEREIQQFADNRNIEISPEELLDNLHLEDGAGDHLGEDIPHDLELIGSTEPINARHKVFMDKRR
ncbi:uncharacterized protein LOC133202297 [Saccostrea echinata]|uniref:uncharacterized protein LOC133202297 n=1 Tax=Saccostrea echinata TaxID=191078 RepID=UPI002A825745|nr:uncharacterized protein LOC133202297 [Saccostrea echinata]